jgi:hypothetical protein
MGTIWQRSLLISDASCAIAGYFGWHVAAAERELWRESGQSPRTHRIIWESDTSGPWGTIHRATLYPHELAENIIAKRRMAAADLSPGSGAEGE